MSITYLLPCACGRKIPVDSRQAGEIISCACGASLEVPTLLNLKTLERAEVSPQPETPKAAWSAGHRLVLLGVIVIFVAGVIGVWLFLSRPTDPYANLTPDQIRESIQLLNPRSTWLVWLLFEKGGIKRHKQNLDQFLAGQKTQYQIYNGLLSILFGLGFVLIAAGIIVICYRKIKPRLARKS